MTFHPDGAATSQFSTVAVERRDAYQRSDLFPVEPSELWHFGEKRTAGHRTDAGNTPEQLFILTPDRALTDASVQIFIGALHFPFQPMHVKVDAFSHGFGSRSQPGSLRHHHLDNLSSSGRERSQFQSHLVRHRPQLRAYHFTKTSQYFCIDAIGLGVNWPMALVKSRTCRGLITTTGNSALTSARVT
jgi:hypothetical protein